MKHIVKILMDIIYLFPIQLTNFKRKNQQDKIVAYGACKGIRLESERDITRGLNWALARRGFFILSDKKIVLGDWEIDLTDIEKAELIEYRSGMVLKISVKDGKYYQFGLQYIRELLKQDVLEILLSNDRVKYSLFSIVIRIVLVIYLVFMAIEFFHL